MAGILKHFFQSALTGSRGEKKPTTSSTALRAASGVAPELATSKGIGWATNWPAS